MKTAHFAVLVLMLAGICSCSSNRTSGDRSVPFTLAQNYFIGNTVGILADTVITDLDRFHQLFGMATTMGPNGKPTPIDFSRQFVIAVAPPETVLATTIQATGLERVDEKLVLQYRVEEGQPQTYTSRPILLVIVDRTHLAPVVLKKQ